MPQYLDDPSVLTKERLKSELLAHNVELPGGNPPKDVYVQLYLKNLTALNQKHATDPALDAFSSDEELPPPVVSVSRRSRSSGRKSVAVVEQLDVTALTDQGLRDQLLKHGVDVGPIVATTRKLYERKLQKLVDNGPVVTERQVNHNGGGDTELYSDREDEVTVASDPAPEPDIEPDPEPVPVLEGLVRSRGNTSSRTHSSTQHTMVEKITAEEPPKEDTVLKGTLTNLNGSGLTATCRRPIKGASARPVVLSDQHHQTTNLNYFSSKTSTGLSSYTDTRSRVNSSAISNTSSAPLGSDLSSSSSTSSRSSSAHYRSSSAASTTSATSTSQPKASGMLWWKKLLLLAVLAIFLFFIYQAMETNNNNPFEETEAEAVAARVGAA